MPGIFVCRQADDGDSVLVCADRAVAAEAPDLSSRLAFVGQFDRFVCQGRIRYVVYDADGEVVFRLSLFQVSVYGGDLSRRRILGSQAVAAADNDDIAAASLNQALCTSKYSGSPMEPDSFVRSSTATFLHVAGIASVKCCTENGRYK